MNEFYPESKAAEESIIKCLLMCNQNSFNSVATTISAQDFADPCLGELFTGLSKMHLSGASITPITLQAHLHETNRLGPAGGIANILRIAETPAISEHDLKAHALLVVKLAAQRKTLGLLSSLTSQVTKAGARAELASVAKQIMNAAQAGSESAGVSPHDACDEILSDIQKSIDRNGELLGIPSGLPELDAITYGFEDSKLYILAGRPGQGKTALGMNFADAIAVDNKTPVMFISMEMDTSELYLRLFCSRAGVNAATIKQGNATAHILNEVDKAVQVAKPAPLLVDDTTTLSIDEIILKASKFVYDNQHAGLAKGIVIVDYIQLIAATSDPQVTLTREREVATVSRGLKMLAKELKIPVIALAQLRRQQTLKGSTEAPTPQLSDLRESGGIENDADVVLLLHTLNPEDMPEGPDRSVDLIVAKNRSGRLGRIALTFQTEVTRFIPRGMGFLE